ncbi:MAG: copper chaperone PCu(A)C [Methylophilales bacterium]|nr:copper chaperone PCu(A)C [Methylophilales bacterium]
MNSIHKTVIASLLLACALNAQAAVTISDAWVRATKPGQEVGAAYMTLNSSDWSCLTKVNSTDAGAVEIHSMSMDNGVMKMRMLEHLELPAGKPVKLAPGGFHLMLFDLKKPLTAGGKLELLLTFENEKGQTESKKVTLPIK